MATDTTLDDRLILTPTSRLARAEKQRRDQLLAEAATAWRTPAVRAVHAWFAELRNQALLTGAIEAVPITTAQARPLWRQVIDRDVFVGEPRVAELAERAWRLIHEHRLQAPSAWSALMLSEDTRRFRAWAARFAGLLEERGLIDEWTFASQLPDLIARGRLALPAAVTLAGFELAPPPLLAAIFDALEAAGIELVREAAPAPSAAAPLPVTAFATSADELQAAARWARDQLAMEQGRRIAVVVPDLAGRLGEAERAFRSVFDPPGFALADRGTSPWHVSLGPPLADWPLVADAIAFLALDPRRCAQPRAARLLRCPWLAGWDVADERGGRIRAEAALLRYAPYELTAWELARDIGKAGAGMLGERITAWSDLRGAQRGPALPSSWAARFQQELAALGFGRGRALDSREWQVLERWHGLLEEFAGLDLTIEAPIRRGEALALLRDRAAAATFRERDPGCPIEILGVQEALGARFDAAWLATLDRDSWPAPARREPLVPGPVQATVPASTSEGCRGQAERELAGLLRIAPTLCGSFSLGDENAPRELTTMIEAEVALDDATGASPAGPTLVVIDADDRAPAFSGGVLRGGTGVLTDQAACPFKALAVRRLGAGDLSPPRPGLDAMDRGTLVHRALESFWGAVPDRTALAALDDAARQEAVGQAVDDALDAMTRKHVLILSNAGRALERECMVDLIGRWLEVELRRGDFAVVSREEAVDLPIGPLLLTGKIDRIDETDAGAVLIDYKTGSATRQGWVPGPRMKDPQLPAYAVALAAAKQGPSALAFARLQPEDLRFDGLAREDVGIRGVAPVDAVGGAWKGCDDFGALLADWRDTLAALAEAFAVGEAAVDPRDDQACRYCHLHALCRIHERRALTVVAAEEDEGS